MTTNHERKRGQDEADPAPRAKPYAVNIRLPEATWSRIRAVLEKRGTGQSLNSAVADAVGGWLAKHERA